MVWQSKEDQRAHIRAQLIYEANNPSDWYKRAKSLPDKPTSSLYKMYVCERASECNDRSCLERTPHEKQRWCLRKTKCKVKNILVKCIEVIEHKNEGA